MDIAVNKPAKDFMKRKFQDWYSQQVTEQLQGKDNKEVDYGFIRAGISTALDGYAHNGEDEDENPDEDSESDESESDYVDMNEMDTDSN